MFCGDRKGISFKMKEGDKIIVTGSVQVYERDGKYELIARQIELDGAGSLYLQFEALKKELMEMGMFEQCYKKPIPKYAKRIGIVTASTGAAIQDICNISKRRNPYVQLILYPALVQGDGAAQSIVNGIRTLDNMGVDIIIAGRGGGSIEDLWAFNERIVAEAIFNSGTPVISAVGHETDTTIADYVADMRAPTPSAAAEIAVFDHVQFEAQLMLSEGRMRRAFDSKLSTYRLRAENLMVRLNHLSPSKLNENLRYAAELYDRLKLTMDNTMKDYRHRLSLLSGSMEALSPAKKLSSGFSFVASDDGAAITDASKVHVGDSVSVNLYKGMFKATVSEVYNE
jgi:exodeoxyribonuclease VII large subunit